jgi:hypothetical protein
MEEISPAERQSIIDSLDEETAAETIAELDKRLQTQVVEKLDPEKAADILPEPCAGDLQGSSRGDGAQRGARSKGADAVRPEYRGWNDEHGNCGRR